MLFTVTYSKIAVRRDTKVELHPTTQQTFTIDTPISVLWDRSMDFRNKNYVSGMAEGENLRECQSVNIKSLPPTAGDDKMLLTEFASAREKAVVFFITRDS